MLNWYEKQEQTQVEILARLQAIEDRLGIAAVTEALTNTTAPLAPPVAETVPVPGEKVGTYSKPE